MKRALPITALLSIAGLLSAAPTAAQEHTKDSLDTVKSNLINKKAVLLDVREKDEWEAGHLDAALLLPLSQLKEGKELKSALKNTDSKPIVYCHCRAGRRALTAADILRKQGYDVRPLKQGCDELAKAGFAKSESKPNDPK